MATATKSKTKVKAMATNYVVGFLIAGCDQVLLIRKVKPAWQAGKLNGPGGKIEPGETPLAAMRREFAEETGLIVNDWERRVILVHDQWTVHFFIAEGQTKLRLREKRPEPSMWKSIKCLPEETIWNLRWLIPLMLDTVTFPIIIHDRGSY